MLNQWYHARQPSAWRAFWIVVLVAVGLAVYAILHSAWYEQLRTGHQASFWVEMLVAGGTLALAVATFCSVSEAVLARQRADFAHQETLTPIVKFASPTPNVSSNGTTLRINGRLVNRGMGPALKVRMRYRERRLIDGPERDDFPVGEYGPLGPRESRPFEYAAERSEEGPYKAMPASYVVTLEYENLFGTKGSTTYIDGSTQPHFSRPPVRIR